MVVDLDWGLGVVGLNEGWVVVARTVCVVVGLDWGLGVVGSGLGLVVALS